MKSENYIRLAIDHFEDARSRYDIDTCRYILEDLKEQRYFATCKYLEGLMPTIEEENDEWEYSPKLGLF